jgi:hypothetical protein
MWQSGNVANHYLLSVPCRTMMNPNIWFVAYKPIVYALQTYPLPSANGCIGTL